MTTDMPSNQHMRWAHGRRIASILLVSGLAFGIQGCPNSSGPEGEPLKLKVAKLLVEHNATDEDTGFQGFADGDPWDELVITGPAGEEILAVNPEGGLFGFGLTELFFETSEPPNDEVPIDSVLTRLAEGIYTFMGAIVTDEESSITTSLTHDIPAGPVLISPTDGAGGLNPSNVVVSWNAVTTDIDDEPGIDIVGYEVIVEENAVPAFPQGFYRPWLSVHVPASVTSVVVPDGFLKNNACYKYEVLAIEESGNQTLSSAAFETGSGCAPIDPGADVPPRLTKAKLLIEHNATDEDTGFQGFADGDPWNTLTIAGPGNQSIVTANPQGGLFNFGLTELFFETSEPKNAEVPMTDVLGRLPEGTYAFTGDMVEGGQSTITATFTHTIPAGPELKTPVDGASDVDPDHAAVTWDPVTTDIDGQAINIVGYQVIVVLDEEAQFPNGFAQSLFSIYLPATATSVTVPAEFMESDAPYKYEVLAIEESGNQTLSSAEFATR